MGTGRLLTFALLLGTAAAQAAPRDAKALAAALASRKAETVAWAAHDSRGVADKALTVAMLRALPTWSSDESDEAHAVVQFLLDALVERKAKIPAVDLLPLLDDPVYGTAAFVLLAQQPQQNEAELLELFRDLPQATGRVGEQSRLRTQAIGNLLCAQRTPGFARLAWQQLDLDLRVEVWDGLVFRCGCTFDIPMQPCDRAIPAGFPPASQILLAEAPQVASADRLPFVALTPLAAGSAPVHWGRIRADALGEIFTFPCAPADPGAWLRQLAGTEMPEPTRVIQGDCDPTAYLAAVDAARTKLRTYKETLRRDLVARKALTAEEAKALSTAVAVTVDDQRTDKSKPLPKIPEQ